MTTYERYSEWKKRRQEESDKRIAKDNRARVEEFARIVDVVELLGGTISKGNTYAFSILLGSRCYNLCNQTTRIVGDSRKTPLTTEECEMLGVAWLIGPDDPPLLAEIHNLVNYESICEGGKPHEVVYHILKGDNNNDHSN